MPQDVFMDCITAMRMKKFLNLLLVPPRQTYQKQIETVSSHFNQIRNRYLRLAAQLKAKENPVKEEEKALSEENSESTQSNAEIINEAIDKAQEMISEIDEYKTEALHIKHELMEKLQDYVETLEKYDDSRESKLADRMLDYDINLDL